MITALLLDLANITGGFLLAMPVLRRLPVIGYDLGRFAARVAPWGWVIGITALVVGGFYLIAHTVSGPRILHFEVVGIGVGLILSWDRLTGRRPLDPAAADDLSGTTLLIAIFGLIAIIVGVQGLLTPDG